MINLSTSVLPELVPRGPHIPSSAIRVSPQLLDAAGCEPEEVFQKLHNI